MRVTSKMTSEVITRELYKNKQALLEAQLRVATGKKINKPSDDPVGMGKVLDYRKIVSQIDQYNENITMGKNQIELTETILDQVETYLNQAKEWALRFSSGSYVDDDLTKEAIQKNIEGIYDDILNLGNSKIGNNYFFGGHVTDTQPFSRDAFFNATYAGDDGDFNVMVNDNTQVKINATGRDIFDVDGTGGGSDIFGALQDLINALQEADPAVAQSQAEAAADDIQNGLNQVQGVATEMSMYYGRLEFSENFLEKYKSKIEDSLEKTESVDMAEAIVEMQLQETAYTTNLETASGIIQKSLVDFIL